MGKHFGETIGPNQGVPNPDVDRDGNVNIRDLTLVAKYFGQNVEQPPSVPFDGLITVTDATFNKPRAKFRVTRCGRIRGRLVTFLRADEAHSRSGRFRTS